jgi:hypothetical protein
VNSVTREVLIVKQGGVGDGLQRSDVEAVVAGEGVERVGIAAAGGVREVVDTERGGREREMSQNEFKSSIKNDHQIKIGMKTRSCKIHITQHYIKTIHIMTIKHTKNNIIQITNHTLKLT